MYRISVGMDFSASHVLDGLHTGHPCSKLHGHNYHVDIAFESETLDDVGFVIDFGRVKKVLKPWVQSSWDHRHLNDVMDQNPTAENISKEFFDFCRCRWPQTSSVCIWESTTTFAQYSG